MDAERDLRGYDRRHDPTRVMALTDGVFAIAITLLVLEIQVPDLASGQNFGEAISEIQHSLVAYLISFVVIAIAWAGHRDLFTMIRRTDRNVVWLKVLYLLPVSILLFGVALLSEYEREPTALSMYGLLLLSISVTRLWVWLYATGRPHLLFEAVARRTRMVGVLIGLVPASFYCVAILISTASPTASLRIYGAVPVLYFVAMFIDRSTEPPGSEDTFT